MVYITVKQQPMYHQMTLEEFLFGKGDSQSLINDNHTNTRTYKVERPSDALIMRTDVVGLIRTLMRYNEITDELRKRDRATLYNTFYIAKKGKGMPYVFKQIFASQKKYIDCDTSTLFKSIAGKVHEMLSEHSTDKDDMITSDVVGFCTKELVSSGFAMTEELFKKILTDAHRRIDAPTEELKAALYQLKSIFEEQFGALYHTSAFAYVKNRSTISALKKHQANESKWFGKYDLSNFFGSTTVDFIMKMFSMIFPFSEVVKTSAGREALEMALSLCVLHGVLPQGTPISPLITNIMMIPIDHILSNKLRDFNKQKFVYTRYADDFLISSRYNFKHKEVEQLLIDTLMEFEAPFTIKSEKTRYGSSAGSNWNLGVMLNKDNKITVGYKKKRQFQAMVSSYVMDKLNGQTWDKTDVQQMEGFRNYYRMVEGETIDKIMEHLGNKFDVEVVQSKNGSNLKFILDDLKV